MTTIEAEKSKEIKRATLAGFTKVEIKPIDYWSVFAVSRARGRWIKRDGVTVKCGHKHKSKAAAERCARKRNVVMPLRRAYHEAKHLEGFVVHRSK